MPSVPANPGHPLYEYQTRQWTPVGNGHSIPIDKHRAEGRQNFIRDFGVTLVLQTMAMAEAADFDAMYEEIFHAVPIDQANKGLPVF